MAADAGELKARATLDNTEFLSALKDMVNNVESNTKGIADSIGGITKSFGEMAEAVGLGEVAKKISEFGQECIDAAAQVNKLQAAFALLAGSAEEGQKVFEDLENLGLHSLFDFADVLAPAAKQMMLLGASAEEATTTMHSLVDAASALKQGPEWIEQVSGAIANMQSHLVASSRDMKALQQSGIDAWGALATQLGVSVQQAQDMVKKGMVTASTVTDAVNASLEIFKGNAGLAADTWKGAMHTLSEEGEKAKAAIGNSILQILNDFHPVLQDLADMLEKAITWWKGLSEPVQTAAIALGLAVPILSSLIAGLTALGPILGTIGAAMLEAFPMALVVAGLAVLAKWVYDEWPAIKAVFLQLWDDISKAWATHWDGVKQWWSGITSWFQNIVNEFAPVIQFLETLFSPLVALWKAEWDLVKSVLGAVWDWIKQQVQGVVDTIGKVVNAVVQFFTGMPGEGEMTKLAAAWKKGTDEIAAQAAATKAQTQAVKDNAAAMTAAAKQRQKDDAEKLAADNRAKAAAAEQKKADEEAKKAAAEQLAYNESLKKTYDALYAVAPDVAKQFSDMYGGIATAAIGAQKIVGKAWDSFSESEKQVITDTLALGQAYKDLGITGVAALEGSFTKATDAFDKLAASGKSGTGELNAAFDSVVAKAQGIVNVMSTDVKDAYSKGLITQQEYYDKVQQNAQANYDDMVHKAADGLATQTQVAAAYQVLENAKQASIKSTQDAYNTAMNAIGEKTQEQLQAATAQWGKYAQTISDKLGVDSRQAMEAHIAEIQSVIAQYKALGQAPPDTLTAWLKSLQDKVEANKPAVEQLADAMKALGATSIQSLNDQIAAQADNLVKVQNLQKSGIATSADVAAAQKKLSDLIAQEIAMYNDQYTPAIQKNDQTATQAAQNNLTSATQVQASLVSVGKSAEASAAIQVAAAQQTGAAWQKFGVAGVKAMEDEYKILGVITTQQLQDSADKAQAAYDKIVASGTASAVQLQEAWVRNQQIQLATTIQLGGEVTEAQKNELAKQQQDLQNHLDITTSQWKTAYDGIKSAVSTTFDSLIKTIVTGKGSFSDIMTGMWQSIAEAAIKGFLEPVTKAIEQFIAKTIADLLSGQGLGGILDDLKAIGTAATQVFTGAGQAASAGGAAASGAGGAASAGGGAASAAGGVSSLFGAISAISGAVSAISSVIQNFQTAHEIDILKSVEHNTRYTMMYVGERADGGILGVLFKIDEEIAWGANAKDTMALKDMFKDWSGPALAALQGTQQMLESIGAYVPDIKARLEDGLEMDRAILDTLRGGFQQVTVTVNAGTLTLADAARQLGNQIASNLTTQLTAVRG